MVSEHGGMDPTLSLFSAVTASWFERSLGAPTQVQRESWPIIASGEHVLISAPTGSGKTLSAFLYAIDRLYKEHNQLHARSHDSHHRTEQPSSRGAKGNRPVTGDQDHAGVRVLYISPLKALGTDIARNLTSPLLGITQLARQEEQDSHETGASSVSDISVGVRSGDSTPQQRRMIARHPPEILVTTPESLYLMLTSKVRTILSSVDTVIVDEIHALAGNKRGAHLALSLERLEALAFQPIQRIGLSATVRPLDEVARFLGGGRAVRVVSVPESPRMDLRVVEPLADMRDLTTGVDDDDHAGGSIWPHIERQVLDIVLQHHTTLVFVNSRGLAERLTARLNDLFAESDRAASHTVNNAAKHLRSTVGSTSEMVHAGDDVNDIAMAHHGSVSKERRRHVEASLKAGRLRCVVATSSLELGIDMGSVDMVVQIAPPLSVSSALQRVGRADHRVKGVSHAVFFPLTREQIAGTAATIESMRDGRIETISVPKNPLDILAQHCVAAAAMDDLNADAWYETVRRSAPFAHLSRAMFDAVLGMLSGAYSTSKFSAFRPILVWNRKDGAITARPGAQRLAVTSGGTIPDRGSFTVVLPESDAQGGSRRVGELDEEMVYESRVGDVITLGTSTWQIREITRDRVIVVPAPGQSARLPFWHGNGNGRDSEYGTSYGAFLRTASAGLLDDDSDTDGDNGSDDDTDNGSDATADESHAALQRYVQERAQFNPAMETRLKRDGLDEYARSNLAALLREQRLSTGTVPDDLCIVVERCPDEEEDWRVIVHSPYGRRVHEPWAMCISARLRERYGYDGAVYAADDGIVLRIPKADAMPNARELLAFDTDQLESMIRDEVGQSALFAAHFRECAARALFMPRQNPATRVPLWQQRLRASQLLGAARSVRNFPLVLETTRECLQDVYDMPALKALMTRILAGEVRLLDVQTATPSPFASSLLFSYTGAFLYASDAPQAERAASTLSVDPAVLEGLLGDINVSQLLNAEVIKELESELQRTAPERHGVGAEGIADLLRVLGPLSTTEILQRWNPEPSFSDSGSSQRQSNHRQSDSEQLNRKQLDDERDKALQADLELLLQQQRIARISLDNGEGWATAQDAQTLEHSPDDAGIKDLVLRYARRHGPFSTRTIAQRFDLTTSQAHELLQDLQLRDGILNVQGQSASGTTVSDTTASDTANTPTNADIERADDGQWLHSEVFRILRSRSLTRVRSSIAPVKAEVFQAFLLSRQGVGSPGNGAYQGEEGLARVIEQLEGLALPAALWESDVFRCRVRDYTPSMLDALLATGQVIWLGSRQGGQSGMPAVAFYLSQSDMLRGYLQVAQQSRTQDDARDARDAREGQSESDDHDAQSQAFQVRTGILERIASGGAFLSRQLAAEGTGSDVLSRELWDLVWQGRLTNSTFAPLRAYLAATHHSAQHHGMQRMRASSSLRSQGRAYVAQARAQALNASNTLDELSGLWHAPDAMVRADSGSGSDASSSGDIAAYALALVETMLDRYGVISPAVVNAEGVEGGFSALYPVLRHLEEHGQVVRGMYITGFGAAQFASSATVNTLRTFRHDFSQVRSGEDDSSSQAIVVDATDPANLYGVALPWPAAKEAQPIRQASDADRSESASENAESGAGNVGIKAMRRMGTVVVMMHGRVVLHASQTGHRVLTFDDDREPLRAGFDALARHIHSTTDRSVTFSTVNGENVLSNPTVRGIMQTVGFVPVPQGMRLYH